MHVCDDDDHHHKCVTFIFTWKAYGKGFIFNFTLYLLLKDFGNLLLVLDGSSHLFLVLHLFKVLKKVNFLPV